MPELPEVETLRRGLDSLVVGERIVSVRVWDRKIFDAPDSVLARQVAGHRIERVSRRGKVLILFLDGAVSLLIHPKMTGQLVLVTGGVTVLAGGHPSPGMLQPMPNATTRVSFSLTSAGCLYFNDARRFGWIRLTGPDPCAEDPFLRRLGPEPLDPAFTAVALGAGLTRHDRAPVKAVLLGQAVVAGLGNIYADESLHRARIHPARPAGDLSPAEVRRLHRAIRATLRGAVATAGTSFAGYVNDFRGEPGYLDQAGVFRREGLLCQVCGTPIARTTVAGRATRFCPRCQRR